MRRRWWWTAVRTIEVRHKAQWNTEQAEYFHWTGNICRAVGASESMAQDKSNGINASAFGKPFANRNESLAIQMTVICSVNFHYGILCPFSVDCNRGGTITGHMPSVTYFHGTTAFIDLLQTLLQIMIQKIVITLQAAEWNFIGKLLHKLNSITLFPSGLFDSWFVEK